MSLETNSLVRGYSLEWGLDSIDDAEDKQRIVSEHSNCSALALQRLRQGGVTAILPQMSKWHERTIACYPRIPLLSYPLDFSRVAAIVKDLPVKAAHSVRKFLTSHVLNRIDFQSFFQAYQSSLMKTLQFIMTLPPKEQGYVIVVDEVEKSNSWMVSLALEVLSVHPPIDVVFKDDLHMAVERKDVSHILMLDDASYSGNQIAATLGQTVFISIERCHHIKAVHLVIPYITSHAEKRISNSISSFYSADNHHQPSFFLSSAFTIPSIGELPKQADGITDEDLHMFSYFLKERYGIEPEAVASLTLTFLDHKVADSMSTPDKLIKSIVGNVVPPYKREYDDTLHGIALSGPSGLRIDLIPEIGPELSAQFAIIQRNEKVYVCTKFACGDLFIEHNGKAIPLKPMEMAEIFQGDILITEKGKLILKGDKIELSR